MFIVKNKKIFIIISILLVLASLISVILLGVKVGIDFKGGALTEIIYKQNAPEQSLLNEEISKLNLGVFLIQSTGDLGYIIKTKDLNEEEHNNLLNTLSLGETYNFEETSFNSIGPSVGRELTRKAVFSVILVIIAIILFIAFAFRKVSQPVSSWKYGFIAIIALIHDIIIPIGVFSLLSFYKGIEMDTLFVVALLTVVGLSVADTIVIFDRVRENLHKERNIIKENFGKIIGKSLNQSFVRSLSTSASSIIVLLSLFLFGPESTKYFALMLTVGMFVGTYSSLFLASPLLVLFSKIKKS